MEDRISVFDELASQGISICIISTATELDSGGFAGSLFGAPSKAVSAFCMPKASATAKVASTIAPLADPHAGRVGESIQEGFLKTCCL